MTYIPDIASTYLTEAGFSVVNRYRDVVSLMDDWDGDLLREPRVCVPIDLQALVVVDDDLADAGVRLSGPLTPGAYVGADATDADKRQALTGAVPFDAPTPRAPGIHLHWAMPDALLVGHADDKKQSSDLRMRALPDRWLVVRIVVPREGAFAVTKGWCIDAGTGASWDLGQTGAAAPAQTAALTAAELTGTAGGTLTWTAGYDAAQGRFAFHDPQDDLAQDETLGGAVAGGVEGGRATYVVVGWWSKPDLDPLDEVRGTAGLARRLGTLGWELQEPAQKSSSTTPDIEFDSGVAAPWTSVEKIVPYATRYRESTVSRAAASGANRAVADRAAASAGSAFGRAAVLAGKGLMGAEHVTPVAPARPEASTLLHGAVVGVPARVEGAAERVRAGDLRPSSAGVTVSLGETLYDSFGVVVAQRLGGTLGGQTPEQREALEELVVAFTQHMLQEIDTPTGAADLDEAVHLGGFTSVASSAPGVEDRLVDGRNPTSGKSRRIGQVTGAKDLHVDLADVFDAAHLALATYAKTEALLFTQGTSAEAAAAAASKVSGYASGGKYAATTQTFAYAAKTAAQRAALVTAAATGAATKASTASTGSSTGATTAPQPVAPTVRSVVRADPPYYVASDPYALVSGIGRSLRHGSDGLWSTSGRLKVRTVSQVEHSFDGMLPGSAVLATLPSGAIPDESTALVREALRMSPHAASWLATQAARRSSAGASGGAKIPTRTFRNRIEAELLLRFSPNGAYTSTATAAVGTERNGQRDARLNLYDDMAGTVTDLIRVHSIVQGEQSPVGLTAWAQPWCPLWLEFRVEVQSSPVSAGTGARGAVSDDTDPAWALGAGDLRPTGEIPAGPVTRTIESRVPLTSGAASAIASAIETYLGEESARDKVGKGEIDDPLATQLGSLRDIAVNADLLGASLDGVRRRLLGLSARAMAGSAPASPIDDPIMLTAGRIRVTGLRVVDTFGRVLDVDPTAAIVPARLTAGPGELLRAPRFSPPTRVRLRFVGAASTDVSTAPDARIDEQDAAAQVSPVCGFLLPDHVDESIEVFSSDATPLGELLVTGADGSSGGGVVWEPAPGRPVPADAAPGVGLLADEAPLAWLATGLVRADAEARGGARAGGESALNALLRSIDTTLWTVDSVAGAGSAQVASIVGSPLAVVRAVLSVDVADDLSSLTLDDEASASRRAAYDELMQVGVRVRLGELTRPDDGLVGWYVDDDFSHVHLVDKAIAERALPSGAGQGFLAEWGVPVDLTQPAPIEHPYVSTESELVVRPGVPRMLTLLLMPGSAVFYTSGVVPRERAQLQRGWFTPAVDQLVPSVRVGPVLVDPGDVRLPLVSALGEKQTLTAREGPTAWRNDAILAATQSALLPDRASVLREGWVRVTPAPGADTR